MTLPNQQTTVHDISAWMEQFAPRELAESWDNVGLLLGDPSAEASRIMTCLTVTPVTTAEAIARKAGLIVSHHPIMFRGVKQVRSDDAESRCVWDLARAGVAVYSPHTAFDNARGGINASIAERLGLLDVCDLRPRASKPAYKVVVYVTSADRDAVMASMFAAGAGVIGNYRECSFRIPGTGTFFGEEGAQPVVGQSGQREEVAEDRLEMVCPAQRLPHVLEAMQRAHSYEEPAYDVYPLHDTAGQDRLRASSSLPGAGRIGRLPEPETLEHLANRLATEWPALGLQWVGPPDLVINHIGICCGAGDDFLKDAHRRGAELLLTGEARFHRALEAEALGMGMIVLGHYPSERPAVEALARKLAEAFPSAEVWAGREEYDPFRTRGNARD